MFYPLAGMLLISMVWCGYWYFAFTGAMELARTKRLELAGEGLQLSCANESWGGFPFRFEFECAAPSLQVISADGTYHLDSAKLLAVAQAYNPLHVLLLISGPSSIGSAGTAPQPFAHEQALISVKLNRAGDFEISSEAANVGTPRLFSASQLRFFARKTKTGLELAATAEQLVVQNLDDSPMPISKAEFTAQTSASFLNRPFGVPSQAKPLDIRSLKISQGQVDFSAQGSVFLDPQHRLAGKLSSETNNIDRLMELISPVLAIDKKDSATIKSLVSLTGSDPATKTTKADFIASEGALYWGPFKLAELAPLY